MAVLNYWVCDYEDGSTAYNIRAKTKKEALALRAEYDHARYGEVRKVTICYRDAFDLLDKCLGENRGGE